MPVSGGENVRADAALRVQEGVHGADGHDGHYQPVPPDAHLDQLGSPRSRTPGGYGHHVVRPNDRVDVPTRTCACMTRACSMRLGAPVRVVASDEFRRLASPYVRFVCEPGQIAPCGGADSPTRMRPSC